MVLRRTPSCDVHHIFIYFIYAEISLMQQMSAYPESGRSNHQKSGEIRGRLRPTADIRGGKCSALLGGALNALGHLVETLAEFFRVGMSDLLPH